MKESKKMEEEEKEMKVRIWSGRKVEEEEKGNIRLEEEKEERRYDDHNKAEKYMGKRQRGYKTSVCLRCLHISNVW